MSSISKKKTILLVDDDATVITALAPQLEESYEVLVARDGLAAAHAYERNVDRIVAMVTDLHMPRLDGRVLAEWVRHIQPRLPVIIISGGIRDREFGEFLRCSSISFLGKPFEPAQLESLLRDLLKTRDDGAGQYHFAVEAVKKLKSIGASTQGTEISKLGRAVYPRLRK